MNDTTKESLEYMMKLQQLANSAVSIFNLTPHKLSEQESVYINAATGGLESAIPLLMAATRDPAPTPTEG